VRPPRSRSRHVEQEEGGALARRQIEQELPDVLAELDLVERVAIPSDLDQAPLGSTCGARPHAGAVQRHAEEVGRRIVDPVDSVPPLPELQEGVLHQLGGVGPVPVTKYRALKRSRCSSAKNAAKSIGTEALWGNLMTSPSACIAFLDAAEQPVA